MLDVSRLLVATLRNDTAYKALTGATASDPRIYPYFNAGAVIDPSQGLKGYITYAQTANPERTSAVGGPVYSIAIWANNFDTAEAMLERVKALLNFAGNEETTLTAPTSGEQYQPYVVGEHWAAQENTKFAGINLQLRFGRSFV
jgi:hypothetical protein